MRRNSVFDGDSLLDVADVTLLDVLFFTYASRLKSLFRRCFFPNLQEVNMGQVRCTRKPCGIA